MLRQVTFYEHPLFPVQVNGMSKALFRKLLAVQLVKNDPIFSYYVGANGMSASLAYVPKYN
jgi:hypothetical protein